MKSRSLQCTTGASRGSPGLRGPTGALCEGRAFAPTLISRARVLVSGAQGSSGK